MYMPLIKQELKGRPSALHYTRADGVKSPRRSAATRSTWPVPIRAQTRILSQLQPLTRHVAACACKNHAVTHFMWARPLLFYMHSSLFVLFAFSLCISSCSIFQTLFNVLYKQRSPKLSVLTHPLRMNWLVSARCHSLSVGWSVLP